MSAETFLVCPCLCRRQRPDGEGARGGGGQPGGETGRVRQGGRRQAHRHGHPPGGGQTLRVLHQVWRRLPHLRLRPGENLVKTWRWHRKCVETPEVSDPALDRQTQKWKLAAEEHRTDAQWRWSLVYDLLWLLQWKIKLAVDLCYSYKVLNFLTRFWKKEIGPEFQF